MSALLICEMTSIRRWLKRAKKAVISDRCRERKRSKWVLKGIIDGDADGERRQCVRAFGIVRAGYIDRDGSIY